MTEALTRIALQETQNERRPRSVEEGARERLLAGIPLNERRLDLAGVSTAILEGGDGPPEAASARYGWPLHVIENAADDPPMEQPEEFLKALSAALGNS